VTIADSMSWYGENRRFDLEIAKEPMRAETLVRRYYNLLRRNHYFASESNVKLFKIFGTNLKSHLRPVMLKSDLNYLIMFSLMTLFS
jgi:hypothetical protein